VERGDRGGASGGLGPHKLSRFCACWSCGPKNNIFYLEIGSLVILPKFLLFLHTCKLCFLFFI